MNGSEFLCKCKKRKTWILEGEKTEKCDNCERVYFGVYSKKKLSIIGKEIFMWKIRLIASWYVLWFEIKNLFAKKENWDKIKESVATFLGPDDVDDFVKLYKKNIDGGGFPYSIHLHEGMQIRNHMRELPECKNWNCHDFDNQWIKVVTDIAADIVADMDGGRNG
jgi:hypothetical protein